MPYSSRLVCLLVTSLFSAQFIAQSHAAETDALLHEEDIFGDITSIETASRFKQEIKRAPVAITIIDQETIAASGAAEIYELLRMVPGFLISSPNANEHNVSSHFVTMVTPDKIEVQVNGRTIYEPLFNLIGWNIGIDLEDIERIEVVRGSSAAVYGANAFTAAINIITKDTLIRPRASVRTRLGNLGQRDVSLNFSDVSGNLSYALSSTYQRNTGYEALDNPTSIDEQLRDSSEFSNLLFSGSYQADLNSQLDFDLGIGRSRTETITDLVGIIGNTDVTTDFNFQRLEWSKNNDNGNHSIQFFHNQSNYRDTGNNGLVSAVLNIDPGLVPAIFPGQIDGLLKRSYTDSFSERFDLEYENIKQSSPELSTVWGVGIRHDQIKDDFYLKQGTQTETRYRTFAQLDWQFIPDWNLNLGAMQEKSNITNALSSRLGLNWQLSPSSTLRASVTHGSHPASIAQTALETAFRFEDGTLIDTLAVPSDGLHEEQVTAYEIAYLLQHPNMNTSFDIRLFSENLSDGQAYQFRAFPDPSGNVFTLGNSLDVRTQGLELQLKHRFSSSFKINLAYTYLDVEGQYEVSSGPLPFVLDYSQFLPENTLNLLLMKSLDNGDQISSQIHFQTEYRTPSNPLKLASDDYTRVDFRYARPFSFGSATGLAQLVVQNAFDEYQDVFARNVVGTRFFFRVGLSWGQ